MNRLARPPLPNASRPPLRRSHPRVIPRRPPAWAGGRRTTPIATWPEPEPLVPELELPPVDQLLALDPLLVAFATLAGLATFLTHHAAPALAFPLYVLTVAACALIGARALLEEEG